MQTEILQLQKIDTMDVAFMIGYLMLVVFVMAMIIVIVKDNRNDRRFWENRK